MKSFKSCCLCILVGFTLTTGAPVATAESRDHPYRQIPVKNVFRLKSPPLEKPEPPKQTPPPVITLQGITTIPGRPHVLFKLTMPANPPHGAKEVSYVLKEGERAGEIEVLEINAQSGTVTFRNHGVVQVLGLKPSKPCIES